jgi:hypothetical protein
MPTQDQIKAIIAKLPELDNPPPQPRATTRPTTRQTERPRPGAPSKGKLTGPKWEDAAKLYDELLAHGEEGIWMLVDQIPDNHVGPAYKAGYFLHGLATYVCRPEKAKQRSLVESALGNRLLRNGSTRQLLAVMQALQVCGSPKIVPWLTQGLTADDAADAVARTMIAIDPASAAEQFLKAYATAVPQARLAILQGIGQSKDPAATPLLLQAASDDNQDVRLTALWSLAGVGAVEGIDPILKATAAAESWPRRQAVRAALLLADNLTAAGKSHDAKRILSHLKEHGEPHLAPALR